MTGGGGGLLTIADEMTKKRDAGQLGTPESDYERTTGPTLKHVLGILSRFEFVR
jgi:hypothetical protein